MGLDGKGWVRIGLVVAALAAVVITSGCGSASAGTFKGPSAEAVAAELAGKPAAESTGSNLTQRSSGGSVTVDVTWQNPKGSGPILFTVVMDTHSVDLDGYDLAKLAVLRNNQGQEVRALSWDGEPGGHHRSGKLSFPSSDSASKPLVGPNTSALELVIRDVAGVKERVLRWEVTA